MKPWDEMIDAEGEIALSRTGRDVGTPIISFGEDGLSFFGLSRPTGLRCGEVMGVGEYLAAFPGFENETVAARDAQLNILGGLSSNQWKKTGGRSPSHE